MAQVLNGVLTSADDANSTVSNPMNGFWLLMLGIAYYNKYASAPKLKLNRL